MKDTNIGAHGELLGMKALILVSQLLPFPSCFVKQCRLHFGAIRRLLSFPLPWSPADGQDVAENHSTLRSNDVQFLNPTECLCFCGGSSV